MRRIRDYLGIPLGIAAGAAALGGISLVAGAGPPNPMEMSGDYVGQVSLAVFYTCFFTLTSILGDQYYRSRRLRSREKQI